jgi:ankyrin repeat protein
LFSSFRLLSCTALLGAALLVSGCDESPEDAQATLAGQGIELKPAVLMDQVKAGNTETVNRMLLAGMNAAEPTKSGENAVMIAAREGNTELLRSLLGAAYPLEEQPNPLEIRNKEGQTALGIAALHGKAGAVSLLLESGADRNAADKLRNTPLHLAARGGEEATLQALLAHLPATGGKPAAADAAKELEVRNINYETPLAVAVKAGQPLAVRFLLDRGADVNALDNRRATPLLAAAAAGQAEIVSQLLQAGAKTDIIDIVGETALSYAVRSKKPEVVKTLLDSGMSADFRRAKGPLAITLLSEAKPFNAEIFEQLYTRTQTLTPQENAAVLAYAISDGTPQAIAMMLKKGTSPDTPLPDGSYPLHKALALQKPAMAEVLLDAGANPLLTGKSRVTTLEMAVKQGQTRLVHKLLLKKVSPDLSTSEGFTPLDLAVFQGYPEIAELLIRAGAEIKKDYLMLASLRDGKGKVVPVLLKHGANPNITNPSGESALWMAAAGGQRDALIALLQYNAKINEPSGVRAQTALHAAAGYGHADLVEILLKAGAKKEVKDVYSFTPLHVAVSQQQVETVRVLVQRGANIAARDSRGRSVKDLLLATKPSKARDAIISILDAAPAPVSPASPAKPQG